MTQVFSQKEVQLGENVRMTTTLHNQKQGEASPMIMLGIPAGLSVQLWQLKELQEKGVFDYYEIFKDYVVLHYRGIEANGKKEIQLDLKADIPGEFIAPASSGFFYYNQAEHVWAAPQLIKIKA